MIDFILDGFSIAGAAIAVGLLDSLVRVGTDIDAPVFVSFIVACAAAAAFVNLRRKFVGD